MNLLLQLIFASVVVAWNHVSHTELGNILESDVEALVAFVAPWTEASKSLEPEWLSAIAKATKLLYSIDCTADVDFCREQEVISYPTIRFVRAADKTNVETLARYRGARKLNAIVAFVNRLSLDIVSMVDKRTIKQFKAKDEVVFIAYPDPEDSVLKSTFASLAARNRDKFTFGLADQQSLANSEGVAPGCVVRYVEHSDPKPICGEWKLETLERFVEAAAAPIVGEMTRRNELKYLKSGKSLVYIFAVTVEERDMFRSSLRELAERYEEYLSFVTVDALEYPEMVTILGLPPGIFPALAVQNPAVGQVFPHAQGAAITEQVVETFVLDIVEGRVQPGGQNEERGKTGHSEL